MRDNSKDLTLKGRSGGTNTNWSRPRSTPDSASLRTSMPSTAPRADLRQVYNRFLRSPSGSGAQVEEPPHPPSHRAEGSTNASPTVTSYAILKPILKHHTPEAFHHLRHHRATASTGSSHRCSSPSKTRAWATSATKPGPPGRLQAPYLVALIDACTRIAWAEVVYDIKSLSVMFAAEVLPQSRVRHPIRGYPHRQRPRNGFPQEHRATPWNGCRWASSTAYRPQPSGEPRGPAGGVLRVGG